jgi:hypothetical protein
MSPHFLRRLTLIALAFTLAEAVACTPQADGKKSATSKRDRRKAARKGGIGGMISKVAGTAPAGRAGGPGAPGAAAAAAAAAAAFSDVRGLYWRFEDRSVFRRCGQPDSLWAIIHPDLGVPFREEYRMSVHRPGQPVYLVVNASVADAPDRGPAAVYGKQILIRRVIEMTGVIPDDCPRRRAAN